jgi:hypothetical protein
MRQSSEKWLNFFETFNFDLSRLQAQQPNGGVDVGRNCRQARLSSKDN